MRIIVVEDDPVISDAITRSLERDGHAVDAVFSAEHAKVALHAEPFDLAVLDIGLPQEDGLQLLRDLRRRGLKIPVLILTARDGLNDRVSALDLGADDYLTKPFQIPELQARCRALLRRAGGLASSQLDVGTLSIDLNRKEATASGQSLDLTAREWSILECLTLNAGHIVPKEKLLAAVSGWGDEITPNAIEVYISRLRPKLADAVVIHAVRGLGYRLDAKQP